MSTGPPADGTSLWGEPFAATECPLGDPQPVLADHTTVTAAHVCSVEQRTEAGGPWAVGVVRRVTGGLPALLATYARPTAPSGAAAGPQGDVACATIGYLPLVVWLVADGRTIPVMEPRVGPCQSPDPAAVAAYRALRLDPVREVRLRQLRPPVHAPTG